MEPERGTNGLFDDHRWPVAAPDVHQLVREDRRSVASDAEIRSRERDDRQGAAVGEGVADIRAPNQAGADADGRTGLGKKGVILGSRS